MHQLEISESTFPNFLDPLPANACWFPALPHELSKRVCQRPVMPQALPNKLQTKLGDKKPLGFAAWLNEKQLATKRFQLCATHLEQTTFHLESLCSKTESIFTNTWWQNQKKLGEAFMASRSASLITVTSATHININTSQRFHWLSHDVPFRSVGFHTRGRSPQEPWSHRSRSCARSTGCNGVAPGAKGTKSLGPDPFHFLGLY